MYGVLSFKSIAKLFVDKFSSHKVLLFCDPLDYSKQKSLNFQKMTHESHVTDLETRNLTQKRLSFVSFFDRNIYREWLYSVVFLLRFGYWFLTLYYFLTYKSPRFYKRPVSKKNFNTIFFDTTLQCLKK